MRTIFLFAPLLLLINSCHKDAPSGSLKEFSDDFENYASATDLTGTADNLWTETNINETNISSNPISIDTTIVHSGKKSVRFDCLQSNPDDVAKCNLNKGNLNFEQGETVYYSCWYYVQYPDTNYGTFFVWDLGQIVEGSLEIRVMAWNQNLELERNKIGLVNLSQDLPATIFPVNKWAHLELEVKLSQYRKGKMKMWLDGKLLIDRSKVRTMPKDQVNMVWGTKGYYERVQVGITAKNGTQDLVLYADDMEIRVK
jgi:hypothetical protein